MNLNLRTRRASEKERTSTVPNTDIEATLRARIAVLEKELTESREQWQQRFGGSGVRDVQAAMPMSCPYKPNKESFFRFIELLNAMVHKENVGSHGARGGEAATTVTVRQGNVAKISLLQKVELLVYPKWVCVRDRNGRDVHKAYREFLLRDKATSYVDTENETLKACCSVARSTASTQEEPLVLVFFGPRPRAIILDQLLHGYLPAMLECVYPHGVALHGQWEDSPEAEESFLAKVSLTHAVDKGRRLGGGHIRQVQARRQCMESTEHTEESPDTIG